MTDPTPPAPDDTLWDPSRKWIRIVDERDDGMVEFEFAVGEPQLFVEMLMPRAQFEDFCAMQAVTATRGRLEDALAGTETHEWDWSLHEARARHFRHEP